MTPAVKKPDLCRISEDAFTQVLSALFPCSSTAGNSSPLTASDAHEQITSSVLLKGPRVSGGVLLQFPKGFLTHATHCLTGLEGNAAESNGLLDDTAGELTNMVAGCVATRLSKDGYACTLGTPSILRNSQGSIQLPFGVERGRAELTWEGHRLAVEIQCQYAASWRPGS